MMKALMRVDKKTYGFHVTIEDKEMVFSPKLFTKFMYKHFPQYSAWFESNNHADIFVDRTLKEELD